MSISESLPRCAGPQISSGLRAGLLVAAFGALVASDAWTVPATPEPIVITFSGLVVADRDRVQGFNAPAINAIVDWHCQVGQAVRRGDRLATFDTALIAESAARKRHDLLVAEREFAIAELALAQELAALDDERRAAESDLAVCRAALATAAAGDPQRLALLAAQRIRAEREVAERESLRRQQDVLQRSGQIAASELAAAVKAVELARLALARAIREEEIARSDPRQLASDRLRVQEAQLLARIGAKPVGKSDAEAGLSGRLAAVGDKQARQRTGASADRDRAAFDLHVAERDTADRTPLAWIEIAGGGSVRRFSFRPSDAPEPAGWTADHGDAFTAERGWGWDAAVTGAVVERGQGEGGSRQRRGRRGRPGVTRGKEGAASPERLDPPPADADAIAPRPWLTLALIQGQATWRLLLPAGDYHLAIGLDDVWDWDGALLRVADGAASAEVIHVGGRQAARARLVVEHRLRVDAGELRVVVGDDVGKALRAPGDGVAWPRDGLARGWRVEWVEEPLVFFADPHRFSISARVRQDQAGSLHAGSAGEHALATDEVAISSPGLAPLRGRITAVGTKPVAWSTAPLAWRERNQQNEQDLIAREVSVELSGDDAARLRLGSPVQLAAWVTPPPGTVVLPAHLAVSDGSRWWVQESGAAAREVAATRIGGQVAVRSGVVAGARLVPPAPPAATDSATLPAGVLVPGRRTPVAMTQQSWGRIKDLVPGGSQVRAGQEVVSLYNPSLEAEREKIEQDKRKARQDFLIAGEMRRVKDIAGKQEQAERQLAGRSARLAVSEASQVAPTLAADADDARQRAELEAAFANERLRGLTAIGVADAAAGRHEDSRVASARAEAAIAGLAAAKARVGEVAALRARDWFAVRGANAAWQDALGQDSLREGQSAITRTEDEIAAQQAQYALAQALEGSRWEQNFALARRILAPADGRIHYLTGWNDQDDRVGTIGRDFLVWSGLTIAEVLDERSLAFRVELPEHRYPQLSVGTKTTVILATADRRRLDGAISEIGKAVFPPRDSRTRDTGQAVSSQRVFTVTVEFAVPDDLTGRLEPGMKGWLDLP